MSVIASENSTHRATVLAAELTRQNALQAAGATTASIKAAEIAFYRTCRASAIANGLSPHQFIMALDELGVGGQ
jgi:hypothetical protein